MQHRVADSCEEKLKNTVLKRSMFLVDGGWWGGKGHWDCQVPSSGASIAVEVLEVRLSDVRSRNLFSQSSSEIKGHSWTLLNRLFPKVSSKECELVILGNSKVGRRHGDHYLWLSTGINVMFGEEVKIHKN